MTVEEIAVKLTEVDSRSKSNTHRITALEDNQTTIQKLATAVEVMATEQKYQHDAIAKNNDLVSKLDTKLDTLEKAPAKRWDLVVTTAIVAVVTYLLTQLGIG